MNFENQTVIVTGGTRGIGAGISEAFLKQNAKVIATYANNDEKANEFKDSIGDLSKNLFLDKFNVASANECKSFFERIEESHRTVHILVNNSGIRKDNIIASMEESSWDDVIDINLKGTFNMCQGAILNMMKNRYGRIINMSSIGGKLGLAGQSNYAASKAGQIALTKSISKEVAKRKITVNCICPGFIETELISDLPEDLVKQYKASIPLKRFGTVSEVASAVMFLASENAGYITGTTLDISGGL